MMLSRSGSLFLAHCVISHNRTPTAPLTMESIQLISATFVVLCGVPDKEQNTELHSSFSLISSGLQAIEVVRLFSTGCPKSPHQSKAMRTLLLKVSELIHRDISMNSSRLCASATSGSKLRYVPGSLFVTGLFWGGGGRGRGREGGGSWSWQPLPYVRPKYTISHTLHISDMTLKIYTLFLTPWGVVW